MKLKAKLRHFWRNNKKCIGMYLTFYCIVMAILALCFGGYNDAFDNLLFGLVWSIVWIKEREADKITRMHNLVEWRYHKFAARFYGDMMVSRKYN